METLGLVIITVLAYIAIYSLVDRVCKCVEHCAQCKGTAEVLKGKNDK